MSKSVKVGQLTLSLVFYVKNLETGEVDTGLFNSTHHPMFGNPLGHDIRQLKAEQVRLINWWNAKQPATWKYWL